MSPPINPPDERLTYEQAYAEHREPLVRFTRRLAVRYGLPDPHRDAEDIVQAAFEEALPQWSSLDSPVRWLYTVARRKVTKAASQAARRGVLRDGIDLDLIKTRGWTSVALRPVPDDSILARQVMDAIAELPHRQRTVTYLRHVQGWTVQEVADLLDCAPGTVWAHTNHGVVVVRQRVGNVYINAGRKASRSIRYRRRSRLLPLLVSSLSAVLLLVGGRLVYRAVRAGWVPWREVGLGVATLTLLFVVTVVVRLSIRWWQRRRSCRS
ncbi:RNA polymerase sigma factor [Micromonospora sp. WMMD718]|uniref:RNA polymerase sigma factor n=1 Tax=unclassified Micromonospora TaxID=2617518 RepID=UPI00069F5D75|nr:MULTISPECIES: RNA polymerase sigma factor [unclassified Micromonospora]MDG4751608.1 RNA polymerase sigma factor [Micromonospora sp. WMMD718]